MKDTDKNASKRFIMQKDEMSKGKTTKKGEQAGRDLMKRVRATKRG